MGAACESSSPANGERELNFAVEDLGVAECSETCKIGSDDARSELDVLILSAAQCKNGQSTGPGAWTSGRMSSNRRPRSYADRKKTRMIA